MSTLYSVQVKDIKGKDLDLHQFKGKKLMIVNVASECGFTQQYAQLEELYNTYKDSLAILGCPCNEFEIRNRAMRMTYSNFAPSILE